MSETSEQIDVAYVAQLARVELTAAETAEFQQEIGAVLEHVRQLSAVDVEAIEPLAHATLIRNVYRDDEEGPTLDRTRVLANAPETVEDDLIRVPAVLGGDDQGGA